MSLIEAGTYEATVKAATLYEAPSGAVMCSMQVDVAGVVLKGGICLVQKDGTLSERGFKDVQTIFGLSGPWDWALWEREPTEWAGAAVQVVVETVQGERGEFSSIKYVNVPGGGSAPLAKADTKSLAAKYGARTRALMGGTPACPPGTSGAGRPAAPRAPVASATPPPPPARKPARPSDMETCWSEFCKQTEHIGKREHELYAAWHAAVLKATGKEQNDCTPEDWGLMFATLDVLL